MDRTPTQLQDMQTNDRAQWIAILEAASQSPPTELTDEWDWLLEQLGLPPDFFLALLGAIGQGRWRTAKNPRSYLRTVAKREAAKMDLIEKPASDSIPGRAFVGDGGSEIPYEEALESLIHRSSTSEAMKDDDGIWRGGDWDSDWEDETWRHEFDTYGDFLLSKLPEDFKSQMCVSVDMTSFSGHSIDPISRLAPSAAEPVVRPNWEKLSEIAGFDEWDRLVLKYRLEGKSRDKAMSESCDEGTRKALQAAWRKFDRTGLKRLQEVIKKITSKDVPE